MRLEILCEVDLEKSDERQIALLSRKLGLSRSEVIRTAVKKFSAQCVPTHRKRKAKSAA